MERKTHLLSKFKSNLKVRLEMFINNEAIEVIEEVTKTIFFKLGDGKKNPRDFSFPMMERDSECRIKLTY